jgi:hypothetical protein
MLSVGAKDYPFSLFSSPFFSRHMDQVKAYLPKNGELKSEKG